jgi:hypothetical protein
MFTHINCYGYTKRKQLTLPGITCFLHLDLLFIQAQFLTTPEVPISWLADIAGATVLTTFADMDPNIELAHIVLAT